LTADSYQFLLFKRYNSRVDKIAKSMIGLLDDWHKPGLKIKENLHEIICLDTSL
jgi:hypothetical protein